MGNESSRSTSSSDTEYSPASTVSSGGSASVSVIVPDPPTPPSKPPTKAETIRNIENYCEANPNLEQLITMYGPFTIQMSIKTNTVHEIQDELNKINRRHGISFTKRINGIQFINVCGTIYFWDNHVGISASDNYRMLYVIHKHPE
jgi:hypothetical protein